MTTYTDTAESKERLAADLRQLIADAEALVSETALSSEDKIVALRDRVTENLKAARYKLEDIEDAVKTKTREVARATDDYVHENPWKAIGAAAGVGLIVGLLISRR